MMIQNAMDFSDLSNTINTKISELQDLWKTESNAPEILKYNESLVNELRQIVLEQQESLDEKTSNATSKEHFTVNIYQMDIERVRYSLSRYLRTRMLKIEKEMEFLQESSHAHERLSDDEQMFINKLVVLNNGFFSDSISSRLHESARNYYDKGEDRLENARPNTQATTMTFFSFLFIVDHFQQEFVFCRAVEDIEGLILASGQSQDVRKGEINILQYSVIQAFVLDGRMNLL